MKMSDYAVYDVQQACWIQISEAQWQANREHQALLLRYFVLPLQETAQTLWLAMSDESDAAAVEMFAFLTQKTVTVVQVEKAALKSLLAALSPQPMATPLIDTATMSEEEGFDHRTHSGDDPIIQQLDGLFYACLQHHASDIHIEPHQQEIGIRLRIDGVLHAHQTLPKAIGTRLLSRLKLLAKLDISEQRQPQDGQFRFTTTLNDTVDFRVSTLPTLFGEKMVLRLQKNKPIQLDFMALGLTSVQQAWLVQALAQPQGLILVTGPTGSGKSITLYSALSRLNTTEKHILTAEDPIEMALEGIIQTQVNPALQLDFTRLLRTFLRQDPDIIMLGEIRDEASAKMALQAAQTGHLVLSTLHTNDALSAIERLNQLGIDETHIRHTLRLVIAQRLVRRLCQQCRGAGCEACLQGYKGRVGVFQCWRGFSDLAENPTACLDYPSLLDSAKEKLKEGITDVREIERVFGCITPGTF